MSSGTRPRDASASRVVELLLNNGVTHAVWLVDTETASMYRALLDAERSARLTIVPVCREGEAIAVALGLQMGGSKPVVIIQSTGLFESGDSLRGQAIDLQMPLVMLIGYRGWKPDPNLVADSAARYLEPVLDAYGIRHWTLSSDTVETVLVAALAEAEGRPGPVAVLAPSDWQA